MGKKTTQNNRLLTTRTAKQTGTDTHNQYICFLGNAVCLFLAWWGKGEGRRVGKSFYFRPRCFSVVVFFVVVVFVSPTEHGRHIGIMLSICVIWRCRCRRHTFRFRSITFEGMHWFHSNSAELYITVKYRSSSILVIIHQILAELWPFFDLVFVGVLILVSGQ